MNGASKDFFGKSYKLLLHTDCKGQLRLYPLLPQSMDRDDSLCVQVLAECMERLPAWRFGMMFTTDGRLFGGRYVNASYSKSGGWEFDDMLVLHTTCKELRRGYYCLSREWPYVYFNPLLNGFYYNHIEQQKRRKAVKKM